MTARDDEYAERRRAYIAELIAAAPSPTPAQIAVVGRALRPKPRLARPREDSH